LCSCSELVPPVWLGGYPGGRRMTRCLQATTRPHLLTRTRTSAELAPSPGEHRSRREGCRASQGRFPPPLWIRAYAIERYAGESNTFALALESPGVFER